jgi:hypothetical protein
VTGGVSPRASSRVIEDVAQEYAGRAVLELIQNGHDAIERGSSGRIHVLLDLDGQQPALYVANDGRPFGAANFDGIIDLGLSPKGAGEGIGNKGLGFRSVLLLTDCPEVYSRDPENPQDQSFSGYSFRCPAVSELADLLALRDSARALPAAEAASASDTPRSSGCAPTSVAAAGPASAAGSCLAANPPHARRVL